jgi:hypothetical protein
VDHLGEDFGLPSLQDMHNLSTTFAKMRSKHQVIKLVSDAYVEYVRTLTQAQLKYGTAKIQYERDKGLAAIEESLLAFMEEIGLQQMQRRKKIVNKLRAETAEWLDEVIHADTPEFMREELVGRIRASWSKILARVMRDNLDS